MERGRRTSPPERPVPVSVGRKPRRGDVLDVEIERVDERGRSIGRGYGKLEGDGGPMSGPWTVHVRCAVPGERVTAQVLRRRGDRVEARVLESLRRSPRATDPRCPHFGTCGGCSFQGLRYEAQLNEKRDMVVRALHATGLGGTEVRDVLPCRNPWNYRNKMEFTFSNQRWIEDSEPDGVDSSFALGLHIPGRFDKVLDVGGCPIQSAAADRILATARGLARELGLAPWDVRHHEGLLRHLVLRVARATSEIMVNLVTSELAEERIDGYARALLERHPEITTFVQNVNTRTGATAIGEFERVLHGPGTIREVVCGLTYVISAGSFFQTNSRQAEVLFELVREQAACTREDLVFDVYCGTGSLSLCLAREAARVVGFELVDSAVEDARRNARANGIDNVEFVAGDVLETLARSSEERGRPDVLVVDPPRAGIHPKVSPFLAERGARRIVYVSCNPRSAAADLPVFVANGYRLVSARPVDLFPHTPHVETVFTLDRADG